MIITPLFPFNFFKQHPLSFGTFAFFIAFYQATILNLAFYVHVFHRINLTSIADVFFLLSMPIIIFCIIFTFFNALIFPLLAKVIAIALFIIGAVLTYFMMTFNIVISHDMVINAIGTDRNEIIALLTPHLFLYLMVLGIIPAIVICLVNIKPIVNFIPYIMRRLLAVCIACIAIITVVFFLYKHYAAFFRNNKILTRYLLPSNYIGALKKHYIYIKNANLPFITIGNDAYIDDANVQQRKKTVMVLIVGETARAQNISFNGYQKLTMPQLASKKSVINFKHTSSCGTFTAHSVPCMFSAMRRKEYDANKAAHQSNILDILYRVGVNVLWHENNGGCKGVCDRIPTIDVTDKFKNHSPLCKNGTCFDEILLSDLDDYIDQLGDTSALITLHMMGSHGPSYYQRYPRHFSVFTPTCNTNEISQCDRSALVNTYDNTLVYTDYVIAKTIDLLEKYNEKYHLVLLYMSDHGESLGENGLYLHSTPYLFAPQEQTHIPFFLWGSPSFFQDKHIDFSCIKTSAEKDGFSHDNLFHTLLGIFTVKTQAYQPKLDIFTPCKR